jgi:hypothetical protein
MFLNSQSGTIPFIHNNLGSTSQCNSDDRNRIIHTVYEKQESYEVDG